MLRMILAFVIALSSFANAQEMEPTSIYNTKLYCYNPNDVFSVITAFGELPLFTAFATIDSEEPTGEPRTLNGPAMFFVNQDTGTWVAGIFSPTGEFCNIAVGANFEPYSD